MLDSLGPVMGFHRPVQVCSDQLIRIGAQVVQNPIAMAANI
jgi:hypothetical protein